MRKHTTPRPNYRTRRGLVVPPNVRRSLAASASGSTPRQGVSRTWAFRPGIGGQTTRLMGLSFGAGRNATSHCLPLAAWSYAVIARTGSRHCRRGNQNDTRRVPCLPHVVNRANRYGKSPNCASHGHSPIWTLTSPQRRGILNPLPQRIFAVGRNTLLCAGGGIGRRARLRA